MSPTEPVSPAEAVAAEVAEAEVVTTEVTAEVMTTEVMTAKVMAAEVAATVAAMEATMPKRRSAGRDECRHAEARERRSGEDQFARNHFHLLSIERLHQPSR